MIERLLQNWPYKLIALVTAITLWAVVNGERNPKVNRSISVDLIRNLDSGYMITSGTDKVDVTIEGPKTEMDMVKTADIQASIDLRGRGAGTYTVPIQLEHGNVSDRLEVRPASPSVTLTIESIASRMLPIDVNFVSTPPVGYTFGDPKVIPSASAMSGRSSIVDNVRRLTVSVDPSTSPDLGIDRYYNVKALDTSGNEVKGIELDPGRVRVKLDLVAVPARKTVFISPTIVGQPQYPYKVVKVLANPETIVVKGKPAALFDISTLGTEDVNIEGATVTVIKDVKLRLLPDVQIDAVRTVRVTVKIEMR